MAASQRGPLIRDQWRAEDDRRYPPSYRDRDPADRGPRSNSSRHASVDEQGFLPRGRHDRGFVYSTRHERERSSSRRKESRRSHHEVPRHAEYGEGFEREREYREERPSRRHRYREYSRSPRSSRRHQSPEPSSRHHSDYHRGREQSPRRARDLSTDRGRERGYPPYSPRRGQYGISYHRRPYYPEREEREEFRHQYHKERPRSPAEADYYHQHAAYRRSPSPDRYHRDREEKHSDHHRHRTEADHDESEHSPKENSRLPESRESPSPPKPSKSSRRSEKQRQRTLKHLRARNKAQDFLRSLSLSPDREASDSEDQSMQQSTRPIQSILDDQPRQPSPPRRIPSFDENRPTQDAHLREHFPMHGMKASDIPPNHSRRVLPHIDTRQSYAASSQYATPTSSHHGSPPHSSSPYSQGRGGWGGQHQYMSQHGQHANAYSPLYRQNSYPPNGHHGHYYGNAPYHHNHNHPHVQGGYQSPSYRGGYSGQRGAGYGPPQDRRFSGGPPTQPSFNGPSGRGRGGHYQNLQWTPNGGHPSGRQSEPHSTAPSHHSQSSSPTPSHQQNQQQTQQSQRNEEDEEENPFRPSKDFRVEDQGVKDVEMASTTPVDDKANMPPPGRNVSEGSQQSKEASKFSFAFKAKPTAPPAAKPPVPDLAQKMKEPPQRKDVFSDNSSKFKQNHVAPREPSKDLPPSKPRLDRLPPREPWHDRHDRRDDRRDRDYDRRWDDRRGGREHYDDRYDRRHEKERERDREREKSPERRMVKKIMKRPKPRPTLPADLAASDSVYYRKPGNESVVGSGTYGKVFKAVHVYSKGLVALKKIRMEGEKDGYPVTAVREIKLLQSLKHPNVVDLQEVMVERNDCFMVFEYLSHDLTGLLNHPTFKLEHGHKKHLAKQLFEGLDYLHRRGVLHRDIKAANILISNTGQLKLADFGLARFFAKRRQLDYTNRVITIWYRPPELLFGETQYGPAVDIWSAACVMVEIFTKHAIFPGDGGEINQLEKVYNVLGTPTIAEWPGLTEMAWFELLRPTEKKPNVFAERYKERLTPAAFELLQAMFLYDPTKRPTAGDVLEHPYFTTEEPAPKQAIELKDLQGEWHEFESKALRRENERKDKEARRAVKQEEHDREKAKRRASGTIVGGDRDPKRARPSSSYGQSQSQS